MMNRYCTVFYREGDADLEERGDGDRVTVGWRGLATAVPCLRAETQHSFETLVWWSSKKPPDHRDPSAKVKEAFGLGCLCKGIPTEIPQLSSCPFPFFKMVSSSLELGFGFWGFFSYFFFFIFFLNHIPNQDSLWCKNQQNRIPNFWVNILSATPASIS